MGQPGRELERLEALGGGRGRGGGQGHHRQWPALVDAVLDKANDCEVVVVVIRGVMSGFYLYWYKQVRGAGQFRGVLQGADSEGGV